MKKIIFALGFILAINIIFCQILNAFPSFSITLVDWKIIGSTINDQYANYFSALAFSVWLLLNYYLEGFRFNSILIIFALFFFYLDKALQLSSILSNISAIFAILYLWSLIKWKYYSLPPPKGNFRTCYKEIHMKDKYQTSVSVYYPCHDQKQKDVDIKWLPNLKYFKQIYERIQLQLKWVPHQLIFDFGLNFLNYITFKASVEQPLLDSKLDVIIFSHGFTQHRNAYTFLCQELASEGYIVFSPQHTEMVYPWDQKQTKILHSGNKAEVMEKYQSLRATHLDWRCDQVKFLIQQLQNGQLQDTFKNLKPLSISLIGHSFGGATVLKIAQEIKLDNVISYDPWLFPFNQEEFKKQLKGRILILSKDINRIKQEVFQPKLLEDFLENRKDVQHHRIKGLDHAYPNDLTYLMATELTIFGEIRSIKNIQQVNELLITLTKKYLKNYQFIQKETNQFY
ncbi:unnamed protein product (macronuclear) [Paramecium tetraurelia]|uniref:1-alkyl-2-acetylglycerophosphocholine esterase n=1 Tax=Paramecium tetraurelia TaxID=5888 RepID=A0BMF5_PARTE|nr:uncharacterized protein GSPATT00030358001 [Paramecium tetraurelia]CAK59722.1 unnamed protein product [Paramecium tetraurelia]|eukprot:XP_001427120.1 hypothetical protein (macronuclear) [Paramecium tetraurelia strain d4-2]